MYPLPYQEVSQRRGRVPVWASTSGVKEDGPLTLLVSWVGAKGKGWKGKCPRKRVKCFLSSRGIHDLGVPWFVSTLHLVLGCEEGRESPDLRRVPPTSHRRLHRWVNRTGPLEDCLRNPHLPVPGRIKKVTGHGGFGYGNCFYVISSLQVRKKN